MTPATAFATSELESQKSANQTEFDRLTSEIGLSEQRQQQLQDEIARLKKDVASMTAAMIQTAKTEKKLNEDVQAIETRLSGLEAQASDIRESLMRRRGVLAEVLGALQRIGLKPPPAILVSPDDALGSVRSAILLGAVVPQLREETTILLSDLTELSRVSESISAERARLVGTMTEQAAERARLSLLLEERSKLQALSQGNLDSERDKSAQLAAKARKAAEAARIAEEERLAREERSARAPVPEPNRLATARPFSALQGALSLPVSGTRKSGFGATDDAGVVTHGDTVRTQSGAIVTAPADATVLYAGPFRSYGQLLILDAGDGYHVVLAGLGRISVSQGQPVLAGEPIGMMSDTRVASAADDGSVKVQPELYIEFRKDQKPVDPSPWWAERQSGRTGHDS